MKKLIVALLLCMEMAAAAQITHSAIPCKMGDCGFSVAYTGITGISASKLLGRGSAGGTGAAQEITPGTGLTISGTTLTPDVSGSGGTGRIGVWSSSSALTGYSALTYDSTTKTADLGAGTINAGLLKATALATPGSITVTPVLTKTGSITTVAGASLADGDYFTLDDGTAVVFEFDSNAAITPGRTAITFTGAEDADAIRDLVVIAANLGMTASTAVAGGAATVSLSMDTPGAVGGTNSENVTDGGFAVTGFANPTAATTVTYKLVAHLADGTATEAGAASSTAASTATLSAANLLRLTWSAVPGAASYTVYRTVAPTSPATTGKVVANTAALTLDDTGLAGGGETAPTVGSTGRLVSTALTASRVPLVGTGGTIVDDAGLTYSGTGATFSLRASASSGAAPAYSYAAYPTYGMFLDTDEQTYAAASHAWKIGSTYAMLRNSVIGLQLPAAVAFGWGTIGGASDTSLSRIAPGVVGVGTGAAGSTAGHLALAGTRGNTAKTVTDNVATDFASFAIADGQMLSGEILYSCKSVKGTDLQVAVGRVRFAATREAAVYTTTVNVVGTELLAAAAGTLTCTISIAGAAGVVTLTATCDTSQASPDGMTLQYRFDALDVGIAITGL